MLKDIGFPILELILILEHRLKLLNDTLNPLIFQYSFLNSQLTVQKSKLFSALEVINHRSNIPERTLRTVFLVIYLLVLWWYYWRIHLAHSNFCLYEIYHIIYALNLLLFLCLTILFCHLNKLQRLVVHELLLWVVRVQRHLRLWCKIELLIFIDNLLGNRWSCINTAIRRFFLVWRNTVVSQMR